MTIRALTFFYLCVFKYHRIILSPRSAFLRKHLGVYPGTGEAGQLLRILYGSCFTGVAAEMVKCSILSTFSITPASLCFFLSLDHIPLDPNGSDNLQLQLFFPVRIFFPFTGIHLRLLSSWCGGREVGGEVHSVPCPRDGLALKLRLDVGCRSPCCYVAPLP